MPFTVLVAADLGGKCNYELAFPQIPTIPELRERMEQVLSAEAALRRPAHAGPFMIHRVQVFDERMEMWVDLVASSQLEDYCQVYVFQKETPWHRDTPGRIPPPVKPAASTAGHPSVYSSAVGAAAPALPRGDGGSPYVAQSARYGAPTPQTFSGPPSATAYPPPPASHPSGQQLYGPGVDQSSPVPSTATRVLPVAAARPGSPYSAAPYGAAAPATSPVSVTHSDKVRSTFSALDSQRARRVAPDEWLEFFVRNRLGARADGTGDASAPFSGDTVEELFQKADGDGDGFVSPEEFQHWAEIYPKLLDSMFFRMVDGEKEAARAKLLEQEQARLDQLDNAAHTAHQQAVAVEEAGLEAKQRIDAAEAGMEAAKQREHAVLQDRNGAQAASDDARQRAGEAKRELQAVRDAGRGREAEKRSLQRGITAAEQKLRGAEAEREKSERALENLRKLMEQAEKDLEAHEQRVAEAKDGVAQAQQKAQEAVDPEHERALNDKTDSAAAVDAELKEAMDAVAQLSKQHKDAQRETMQAVAEKSAAERDAAKAAQQEQAKKAATERALKAADDQRKVVMDLEEQEKEAVQRRQEEEVKENDLLELEVRLREQREAVERKEAHLRDAHRDWASEAGRAAPLIPGAPPSAVGMGMAPPPGDHA